MLLAWTAISCTAGGSPQRFCAAGCRNMFWSALRQFGERALANGTLTVTDIRSGLASACTLPQYTERLSPLPDNRRGGNAPPDAPLRFFVDLERDRIAWLVRLRLIKPNKAHDLVVILTALKRIGHAPSISCGP